jgi:hypothetical protein
MSVLRSIAALIVASICLSSVAAMGFEPMTATIRVSNDSLYDYVVIGEHPSATDGFDNAYDTVSPGNLNADMGQPYISVIISHPDWKPAVRELRGDIRSPAKRQEWQLSITSSLPKGTQLDVTTQAEGTNLSKELKLLLKDGKVKKETNMRAGTSMLPAPGPGKTSKLVISAEQP